MTTRTRRIDLANEQAAFIRRRIGRDVRVERIGAGLSIDRAAIAASLSPSMYGRIERGVLKTVTVEQLCRACAAVGLRFRGAAYPAGAGVREAGHVRLLERLHGRLPASAPWRTEVPMPIRGDLRAWDAMTVLERVEIGIEAEMRLVDAQAVDRKIALKKRDSGVSVAILLLPDTNTNRAVLAADREALRANFPLDTRAVLNALSHGHAPRACGIVVL